MDLLYESKRSPEDYVLWESLKDITSQGYTGERDTGIMKQFRHGSAL
jgi:hypothetical protein